MKIINFILMSLVLPIYGIKNNFSNHPTNNMKLFCQMASKNNFSKPKIKKEQNNKPNQTNDNIDNKLPNKKDSKNNSSNIKKDNNSLKIKKAKEIVKAILPFGSTDKTILSFNASSNRTVIIGTSNANGNAQDFTLARYTSNGRLDTTFGTRGVVITDFLSILGEQDQLSGSIDIPQAFVVQSNGNIVVAGISNALNPFGSLSKGNFALARYTNAGRLDTSFGFNGVTVTDIGQILTGIPGSNDEVVAMNIQSNGNIIVVGHTSFSSNEIFLNNSFAIARYRSNGDLDTSFGTDGVNIVNFALTLDPNVLTASIDIATSMQVLSNGTIIICGYSNARDPNFDFAIARFSSNGQLDNSFGTRGVTLTNISSVLGTSTLNL